MAEQSGPTQVLVGRSTHYADKWVVLAEVREEPLYSPLGPGEPLVVVRQHADTREVRVDVYGCDRGLGVTFTNGGTGDKRGRWFRDVLTGEPRQHAVRVRFLGDNLELRS